MSRDKKEKKVRVMPVGIGILIFLLAFGAGVVSKVAIKPSWAKDYSVKWSDEIGTLKSDLSYGDGAANKFDLYLPKDGSKDSYGLVVYLHAGGFTSGDKTDDRDTLTWLCSKGYVAAGINYTLRTDTNAASVLSQSARIRLSVHDDHGQEALFRRDAVFFGHFVEQGEIPLDAHVVGVVRILGDAPAGERVEGLHEFGLGMAGVAIIFKEVEQRGKRLFRTGIRHDWPGRHGIV